MSDIEIKTHKHVVEHTAPHVPSSAQLLMMKAQGLGVETIAKQIDQSVRTTRALLSQAQRSAIIQAARDILARDLIPQIVDNISAGLDRENVTKRDLEVAEYSLKLADRMGLTEIQAGHPSDQGGEKVETFEEYIVRRRTKTESTQPARSADDGHPVVVTATSVNVSPGDTSNYAVIDAEFRTNGSESRSPEPQSP